MNPNATLYLTEKHIIKLSNSFYKECDKLSWFSKNIYNKSIYLINDYYNKENKYLTPNELYHKIKTHNCYQKLPKKVLAQTRMLVGKMYKSFFAKIKNDKTTRPPGYLNKKIGKSVVIYEKGALSKNKKKGYIHLSQTDIYIKSNISFNDIKEVRIVPRNKRFHIEVVYIKSYKALKKEGNIAGLDIGVNNLASVFVTNNRPFIINGKSLKSINQFYNKNKAKIQSELEIKNKKRWSSKLTNITNKRNDKVNDYLHKASKILVDLLVLGDVKTLVIGKNPNLKRGIKIGKKNNQNFVNIPHSKFIDIIKYKCELHGITIIITEESYTSKSSFIDNDILPKYVKGDSNKYIFSGKRVYRGLYRTKYNTYINADINGALNIIRKAIPGFCINMNVDTKKGNIGCAVHPVRINISLISRKKTLNTNKS